MQLASRILAGMCAAGLLAACSSSAIAGHGGGSRSAAPPGEPASSAPSSAALPSSVDTPSADIPSTTSTSPSSGATTTVTVTAPNTGTTTPGGSVGGATPSGFVGTWSGHSRTLFVRSDGAVTVTFRTYVDCTATVTTGCDRTVGHEIHDGGLVQGRVVSVINATTVEVAITSTSAPSEFAAGMYRLGHDLGHDALAFLGGGFRGVPFCGPGAPSGYCGA